MNDGPKLVDMMNKLFKEVTALGEPPNWVILARRAPSLSQSHRRKILREERERCARGIHRASWWFDKCPVCGATVERKVPRYEVIRL